MRLLCCLSVGRSYLSRDRCRYGDRSGCCRANIYAIEIGKQEGRLELAMIPKVESAWGKPMVGPHVFSGIEPDMRLANEEDSVLWLRFSK